MRGYKSEKERIHEVENTNAFLDNTAPSWGKINLRNREVNKEINPPMRFQAKSGMERVINELSTIHGGYVEIKDRKAHEKMIKSSTKTTSSSLMGVVAPRNILDVLHKKTHFKAVTSVSLGG